MGNGVETAHLKGTSDLAVQQVSRTDVYRSNDLFTVWTIYCQNYNIATKLSHAC